MPYLGNSPSSGGYHKLDSLTASATATYALTLGGSAYYPATANQLLVSLNGVIQAPQDSFTISGSNIVFASALSASDSIDFIMSFGDVYNVGTPADGTITDAKIQSMAASKLTGALPAIDGSALTGISGALKKIQIIPIPPTSVTGSIDLIPLDNTLPLITEGFQVVQANFTPAETSSTIFVDATFRIGEDSNVVNSFTAALFFNDTCVNVRNILGVSNKTTWQRLQALFTNTTGSALDIEIRCDQRSEFEINGQYFSTTSTAFDSPTTSTFGGTDEVNQTYITVTEF